ncbi:MAG: outer membrane lipoprotein carrier protein LolA [Hyphomicrobiaceae bacterium]|nr:outer membrane lipoprotein carrier protein LolA [Hyphomicrobiaceae bacterium]
MDRRIDRRRLIGLGLAALPLGFALSAGATRPALALDRALSLEEEGLLRAISIHNSRIHTMVGKFLQIDTQGGRTEGMFYLERPDKIAFRYAPPSREEIVSVGRGFYVLDRREQTKYAYPQDKVPLRQFLTDEIDLTKANISDVLLTDAFIAVTLYDESPMGTVEVSLIFEIDTLELWQWTLTEPSGAELTFSIYDVQQDVTIPPAYFSIPANYKTPANH